MQFFLFDFALALVALLGYRALAAVIRDRVPAVSLAGRPHRRPARNSAMTRRHSELEPAPPERPQGALPLCESIDGLSCGERPPHRLINFW